MKREYVIASVIGLCAIFVLFYLVSTKRDAPNAATGAETSAPVETEGPAQSDETETEEIRDTEEGTAVTSEEEQDDQEIKEEEGTEVQEQKPDEKPEEPAKADGRQEAPTGGQDTETEEVGDEE